MRNAQSGKQPIVLVLLLFGLLWGLPVHFVGSISQKWRS